MYRCRKGYITMVVPGCAAQHDDADMQSLRPFNVSSRRFATPAAQVNTSPGPGLYNYDDKYGWHHGSFGRKGYGSLVSSSRLRHVVYTGPGPASYSPSINPSTGPHQAGRKSRSSSNRSSARLCSTTVSSNPPPGAYGAPGVHHSGTAINWCSSRKPGAAAAFRATARQHVRSAIQRPPLPELQQQPINQHTALPGVSASSSQFQLGSRAQLSSVPPGRHVPSYHRSRKPAESGPSAAPAALTSAQLAHRLSAAVLGRHRCMSAPTSRGVFDAAATAAAEVPGVGSYNVAAAGAISTALRRQLASGQCSSMFAQQLVPSRSKQAAANQGSRASYVQSCGGQEKPQHTNPSGGQGSRRSLPGVRSPGHSQAIMSATDADMTGAPGPAFYQPSRPPAKIVPAHHADRSS